VPVVVGVTVSAPPAFIVADAAAMVSLVIVDATTTGLTVIVTVLVFVESSVEVAVIATDVATEVVDDAVKTIAVPAGTLEEMFNVPAFAGFILRFAVLANDPVPVTARVSASVCPAVTISEAAVRLTWVIVGFGGGLLVPVLPVVLPPQAVRTATTESKKGAKALFFIFTLHVCKWQVKIACCVATYSYSRNMRKSKG
jgi:hypothetical protein